MGFDDGVTTSDQAGTVQSSRPASFHGMSYILLDIRELQGAHEGGMHGGEIGGRPLAKLVMDPGQQGFSILDTSKCLFEMAEQRPTISRLRELHIEFRFHDNRIVNFNTVDHSFTLELETADVTSRDIQGYVPPPTPVSSYQTSMPTVPRLKPLPRLTRPVAAPHTCTVT